MIAVRDGLKGMSEALGTVFPSITLQTCIVHLLRNSPEFANWKQRKPWPPRSARSTSRKEDRRTRVQLHPTPEIADVPAPRLGINRRVLTFSDAA